MKRRQSWGGFWLTQVVGWGLMIIGPFLVISLAPAESTAIGPAIGAFIAIGALAVFAPLVIAGFQAAVRAYRERFPTERRRRDVADEAVLLGLRSQGDDASSLTGSFPAFLLKVDAVRFRWVFTGTWHGIETQLFDLWYRWTTSGWGDSDAEDLTCVRLSLDVPIPPLTIRPAPLRKRIVMMIARRLGSATGDDAFDRAFEIRDAGTEGGGGFATLNASARSILSEDRRARLVHIERGLLYCTMRVELSDRRELLERAERVHHALRYN